jgi:DNA-binding MarR family transcriptional regulator
MLFNLRGERMPNHYESLAELDYQMQRFERLSDQAAQNAGLQPLAAKLLLALKGLPEEGSPTVGEIAERLHVRHHTVVGVVNRLVGRGFLVRCRGAWDRRVVLYSLRPLGKVWCGTWSKRTCANSGTA